MSPTIAVQPSAAADAAAYVRCGTRLEPGRAVEDFLVRLGLADRRTRPVPPGQAPDRDRPQSPSRRLEAEAFIVDRDAQSKALARAGAMLRDAESARDAVAEANLALLRGKTEPRHYYRKLWQLCMDRLRRERRARKVLVQRHDLGLHGERGWDSGPADPALDGGDPLEILIRREEVAEGIRLALGSRRYKDARRTGWWKQLISHHLPQEAGEKRSLARICE